MYIYIYIHTCIHIYIYTLFLGKRRLAPARWDAADGVVGRLVGAGGAHHAQRREVLARRERPPHKHLLV